MVRKLLVSTLTSLRLSAIAFGGAGAQDRVKVGLILPMTGPFTSTGKQIDAAVRILADAASSFSAHTRAAMRTRIRMSISW